MAPDKPTAKKSAAVSRIIPTKSFSKFKSSAVNDTGLDEFEEWKRARQLLRPPDQLPLTDAELKEEVARVLTSTNPQPPDSLVEFNYAQGCFLPVPSTGNTVILMNLRGTTIHKDTEEAKTQMAELGEEDIMEDEPEALTKIDLGLDEGIGEEEEQENEDDGKADEEGKADDEDEVPKPGPKKKLTNQFNFCERAALTYNNPCRSQETQTIPPPRANFGSLVLQWIIFDAYEEDYAAQQREKEKEKKVLITTKKVTTKKKKAMEGDSELRLRMHVAWKTLERMVNLNTYDDIAKDYRYWEDPSDEFREDEGTLLPLWKFSYEKTRKSTITDIIWNPWYYDLFAVCFGTLIYKVHCQGALCLFTLKNPSFPEQICLTNSSVMCVDIHPKFPFMVVIGLYDGNVMVYNVTTSCKSPQYKSNAVTNKHSGIVWKVKWGPDMQDGEMNFYSVAADGKVNNWILMQSELAITTIITLYIDKDPVPGPDGTFINIIACATAMVFHPTNPLIFLVGTEGGLIYKCSTLYSATYLFTYQAHTMPVYSLDYNKFNSDIFLSCSADFRIKIWEDNRQEPLFVFDLGASIGCAAWAPYSSTVFATSTQKGRIYVFDLNINKYKSICKQSVVSKKKNSLTRLSFNSKLPVIIVGDDKGTVHTVKLSPNLRIPCKAAKRQQHLDQYTLQCMKLDKLLALVREPPVLTRPADVEIFEE